MKPALTVIVVFYNMRREAARTLYALSTAYQRDVSEAAYRVLAIDNASTDPLDPAFVASFGGNFAYVRLEHDSRSPAIAANHGVKQADTDFVAVIIDGARMPSPGIIAQSLAALRVSAAPLIGALAWHLGPDARTRRSAAYNQDVEDRLLEQFDWRANGYELFRHANLAKPSYNGFLGGLPRELSYFVMRRDAYHRMGGLEERFASPGGGQVNHDFMNRVVANGQFDFIMLLGEGVFHQYHGGVTSGGRGIDGVPRTELPAAFADEYRRIRGVEYAPFDQPGVTYFGAMGPEALPFVYRGGKKLMPVAKNSAEPLHDRERSGIRFPEGLRPSRTRA